MPSVHKVRRTRIREIMRRGFDKLGDPSRFSTHELHGIVQAMTKEELKGIPFAASLVARVARVDTFSMFIVGHPEIGKHEDLNVNIASFGEGRTRSAMWELRSN